MAAFTSDCEYRPGRAVFVSYAGAETDAAMDIASRVTGCGATAFLDEAAWTRPDAESHVLNALGFADEVVIVITPTSDEYIQTRRTPAFLDRRFVWLAVGVAFARKLPVRGVLERIERNKVTGDSTIPIFIREGQLFDSLRSYEADLARQMSKPRLPARLGRVSQCRVCLCHSRDARRAASRIEKQLETVDILVDRWAQNSSVDNFHAAVVVCGEAGGQWCVSAVPFLEDFLERQKPVAVLHLQGSEEPPEMRERLPNATRIEYRHKDKLSVLRLIWTIVGYRPYDSTPIFISYSHRDIQWLEKIEAALRPPLRGGIISAFVDTKIPTGAQWEGEIEKALRVAKVAVPLVSNHYLESEHITQHELPRVIEAAEQRRLRIAWVPVSKSGYMATDLKKYQAAWDPARPLDSLSEAECREALAKIAEKIAEAAAGEPPPPEKAAAAGAGR